MPPPVRTVWIDLLLLETGRVGTFSQHRNWSNEFQQEYIIENIDNIFHIKEDGKGSLRCNV